MAKAPEQIFADRGPRGGWIYREERMPDTEHTYIRADAARQEAAARVAALAREVLYLRFYGNKMCIHDAEKAMVAGESDDWILREIDTTARVAYEAALERARREGFEEGKEAAAHFVDTHAYYSAGHGCGMELSRSPGEDRHHATVAAYIRALPINVPMADEMQRDAERRQAMEEGDG